MPHLAALFLLLGAVLAQPLPSPTGGRIGLEQAVLLAQRYLNQPLEPYKAEFKRKPREGLQVWEIRLGGFEVWVDTQNGQVTYLRARPAPPHTRQPHLPFSQALALAKGLVPSLEELELKLKEGRLIWEAKGAGREVWLDGRDGRLIRSKSD
ncbi:hypothetical protein [Meiothermus sp. CFH 77666]|uniref:hypothetical protein n=1 Tax=Meiothermus sp. CFH 77666 TaxID=2817942 RepID=UPI001AA06D32|nr:hypothetical protein [Meiothermus sp. CFH 77666]MBO1438007.1 hypothetical protein [Meiothermus sp. CFH 77666]